MQASKFELIQVSTQVPSIFIGIANLLPRAIILKNHDKKPPYFPGNTTIT